MLHPASLLCPKLNKRRAEGLTTPKQIRVLERYGFQSVGTWSFDAAKRMIDRIAAGGCHRLHEPGRLYRAENLTVLSLFPFDAE